MLITDEYLALQRQMHAAPKGYGGKGDKWADVVEGIVKDHAIGSVLDYGCGQGSLGRELAKRGIKIEEYDPAIRGKDKAPKGAELVVTTDVLEHVEPDRIDDVLDHLRSLTKLMIFAVIATGPAGKHLPDGRNAHILLRDRPWWHEQFGKRFNFVHSIACREHKEVAGIWSV
jgi:hypothetical protein